MTQSPYTLYKQSLHPYSCRLSPMTGASESVFLNTFLSIPNCIRQYQLLRSIHFTTQFSLYIGAIC